MSALNSDFIELDMKENLIDHSSKIHLQRPLSLNESQSTIMNDFNLQDKEMRFVRPTNFKIYTQPLESNSNNFDSSKTIVEEDNLFKNLYDKDYFGYEMQQIPRNRLYSQGKKIKPRKLRQEEKILVDSDGFLLPAKTLSEYVYKPPTIDDMDKFIERAKVSNNILKRTVFATKEFFTNNSYFQTLFPLLKEQKPGKDFYTWTALIQFTILIYLIPFFTRMEKAYTSESTDDFSTNQFSGTMVLAVFAQIAIIILDRFLYLSRSFITIDRQEIKQEEDKIVENASVSHSKSIGSINKMSTFNLNSSIVASYIKKTRRNSDDGRRKSIFHGDKTLEELVDDQDDQADTQEIKLERNNSHQSIMMKYCLQLFMLISVHYIIFWHFPSRGNSQIQGHSF